MVKISILGSGTVGTVVGKGFLKLGNTVIFYDVNEKKVRKLCDSGFDATCDCKRAVFGSTISFVCVPTPVADGKLDLSYIKAVVEDLGLGLKKKDNYHVVVVKSTVIPTTTERIVIPLLEMTSGKQVGDNIGLCVNPEFLTEIHRSWTNNNSFKKNFSRQNRVVIGEFDKKSGNHIEALYRPLKIPIVRTTMETAEMIKYACNCALATKISYWNEIFYICRKLRIDSDLVAYTAAMDERIGKYGIVHGKAFGGKCLPKDLKAFISFSQELSYEPELLKAVERINAKIAAEFGIRE